MSIQDVMNYFGIDELMSEVFDYLRTFYLVDRWEVKHRNRRDDRSHDG